MPIIYSFPVFVSLLGGAAFGTGAFKLTGSENLAVLVAGIMVAVIDGAQRTGSSSNVPALDPELGGHLYFIPGWVFGVIVTIAGLCMITGLIAPFAHSS